MRMPSLAVLFILSQAKPPFIVLKFNNYIIYKGYIMHEKIAPQNLWGKIFEFRKDTKYEKTTKSCCFNRNLGTPRGNRTPVTAVKGRCPNR